MTIWFVRHSKPSIAPGMPAATWELSPEGQARADELGQRLGPKLAAGTIEVFASAETKAVQTAEQLGLGLVSVDERFGEVQKPWYDSAEDHQAAVRRFLVGEDQPGWEKRHDALERFADGIASISDDDAVVATHGTVLSLWLSQQIAELEPSAFWLHLEMPDAWLFDPTSSVVTRLD